MQVNALPYAVQLRELHRQELYAEANHERLVRQALALPHPCQWALSGLRGRLVAVWVRVAGQRYQSAPDATGTPSPARLLHELASR